MTNEEMKKYAIMASVFALVSMSLIIHRSATKHIMITDAAGIAIDREDVGNSYTLLVDKSVPSGKEGTLIIPLPKSVSSDNISLEDRYVDHELSIYIESRETGFYMDNAVATDLDIIESAMCTNQSEQGNVCLDFKLDGLYANESALTDSNTIEVKFYEPSEKYEHIAVVDAEGGGSDTGAVNGDLQEKDITLGTALLLKELADKDQQNDLKIYYTRLSDKAVDIEKRNALVRDSGAELVVELAVDDSKDSAGNGIATYYNDEYFLRSLSNAEFADVILESCASTGANAATGVFPVVEDDFIKNSKVPSCRLSLGEISGDADAAKLSNEAYQKKLAEGIYSGILKSFEVMR
jgi:N-acetylmuramoyl-L-alanine amidase